MKIRTKKRIAAAVGALALLAVICVGNRTKIPRKPFLRFLGEEETT